MNDFLKLVVHLIIGGFALFVAYQIFLFVVPIVAMVAYYFFAAMVCLIPFGIAIECFQDWQKKKDETD